MLLLVEHCGETKLTVSLEVSHWVLNDSHEHAMFWHRGVYVHLLTLVQIICQIQTLVLSEEDWWLLQYMPIKCKAIQETIGLQKVSAFENTAAAPVGAHKDLLYWGNFWKQILQLELHVPGVSSYSKHWISLILSRQMTLDYSEYTKYLMTVIKCSVPRNIHT